MKAESCTDIMLHTCIQCGQVSCLLYLRDISLLFLRVPFVSEKQRHCWNLICSGRLRKWALICGSDNIFVTISEGLEAQLFPSSLHYRLSNEN